MSDDLPQGFEWSYWMCKKHGNIARRMYQPNSLSNPIIGNMPNCACSADPKDQMVFAIAKDSYDLRIAMKKMMPIGVFARKLSDAIDKIPDDDGEPGYFADVEVVKSDENDNRAILSILVPEGDTYPVASRFVVEIRRIPG